MMQKKYKIEVDCANCALKMEEAAKKVAGVANATVSFMTQKMNVEFEEGADVTAVMAEVKKNCDKLHYVTFYVIAENSKGEEVSLITGYDIVFAEKDGRFYTFG